MKTEPTLNTAWHALTAHKQQLESIHLRDLFAQDPHRSKNFSLNCHGLFLDYSKNHLTAETLPLLIALAESVDLECRRQELLTGKIRNLSENRPVWHTALRTQHETELFLDGKNILLDIKSEQDKMLAISEQLRAGLWLGGTGLPITDVVHIGIGGSYLGPRLAVDALTHTKHPIQVHFLANLDPTHFLKICERLNPATTLFIVASKTFTTEETLCNAHMARDWLQAHGIHTLASHFIAITACPELAYAWGIPERHCLRFWDWVGGRFSVWSAVGLPIAIQLGMPAFHEFLKGAADLDEHFKTAPFERNMPVILALLSIWTHNFWGANTQLVLPYAESLRLLPSYLQQLGMESLGKRVTQHGDPLTISTGQIIWGEVGTLAQHSFQQLLMQGSHLIPTDFILVKKPHHTHLAQHQKLLAHGLAQSQALAFGKTENTIAQELISQGVDKEAALLQAKHQYVPGNQPSNTLFLSELTPYHLGMLLALYEHKVFAQSVIFNCNPFDQWGVELGKSLAKGLLNQEMIS